MTNGSAADLRKRDLAAENGMQRAAFAFLVDNAMDFRTRYEAAAERAVAAWLDKNSDRLVDAIAAKLSAATSAATRNASNVNETRAGEPPANGPLLGHPGDGWIYLIGSADHKHVKLGTTENVARRLRELQTGSPVQLQVLWTSPGGRPLEKALHRKLDAYRQHGEWFDLSGHDPVELVRSVAQGMGVQVAPAETDLLQAERHFLGALLGGSFGMSEDPTLYPNATFESFTDPRHRLIVKAVANLNAQQDVVNIRFVADELRKNGQLDEAGGAPYLEKLLHSLPRGGKSLLYYYRALLRAWGVGDE